MGNCSGITDKRLGNKRFFRAEEAILKAFFVGGGYVGTTEMAARAGVARATFYRHHRTVGRIMTDYRSYVLNKYWRMMRGVFAGRGVTMRVIYWRTLVFIAQERRVFRILMRGGEHEVFGRIIMKLGPRLTKMMGFPKNADRMYLVYAGEVAALLDEWCRRGAKQDEIEKLLGEIMYLTETARVRLKVLL